MNERVRAPRPLVLGAALGLLLHGCSAPTVDRQLLPPAIARDQAPEEVRFLKAHLRDGSLVVFSAWSYEEEGERIVGPGERFDPHRVRTEVGEIRVGIADVALVETNVLEKSHRLAGLAILFGVSLTGTVLCATNPKACFGSCPTFYVPGPGGEELRAEGFSASISPALERSDRDALGAVPVQAGRISLTMKNEALETHVVRSAELEVAPLLHSGEVCLAGPDGSFLRASRLTPPDRCLGPDSDPGVVRDWSPEVRAFDGIWRSVPADSLDLAAREELRLHFASPPEGELGLVVSARQSLVTTFLFYQALAWMGTEVGRWLALLERLEPEERAVFLGPGDLLGRIEVEARSSDGTWVPIGSCGETGPLATDTWCLPLPSGFTRDPDRGLELRVTATRGLWRFDRFALARMEGTVEPLVLPPSEVWKDGHPDPIALDQLLQPELSLVTFPGDTYELVYELPGAAALRTGPVEAFLRSRGYYLEWMRDAWLEEEDPARISGLLLDPARTLRELAPRFHAIEAAMERTFWESRYATP